MPDDVSASEDPRTVDDLLSKMLGWFGAPQAPNGPQVPTLNSRGNTPSSPLPPAQLNNPHRTWGGAEQQYPPVDPKVLLEMYEAEGKKRNYYGR